MESHFQTFTEKPVADAAKGTEAILALTSGGKPSNDPSDPGFRYSRSFQDPDGHLREAIWMDPKAVNAENK